MEKKGIIHIDKSKSKKTFITQGAVKHFNLGENLAAPFKIFSHATINKQILFFSAIYSVCNSLESTNIQPN